MKKIMICLVISLFSISAANATCTSLIWSCGDGQYEGTCANVGGDPSLPCPACGCYVYCDGSDNGYCVGSGGGMNQ